MIQRFAFCALALLVALAAAVPSGRWYRCQMDGALHATCCCAAQAEAGVAASGPCTARADGCCDSITLPDHPDQHLTALPVAADDAGAALAVGDPVAVGLVIVDLGDRRAEPDRRSRRPGCHPAPAPLFQRYCSYLI